MFPVPQNCLCSPVPLIFMPLFPCSPKPLGGPQNCLRPPSPYPGSAPATFNCISIQVPLHNCLLRPWTWICICTNLEHLFYFIGIGKPKYKQSGKSGAFLNRIPFNSIEMLEMMTSTSACLCLHFRGHWILVLLCCYYKIKTNSRQSYDHIIG